MRRKIKRNLQRNISYSEISKRTGVEKSTIRSYAIKWELPSQHKKFNSRKKIWDYGKPTIDSDVWFISFLLINLGISFLFRLGIIESIIAIFLFGISLWLWLYDEKKDLLS